MSLGKPDSLLAFSCWLMLYHTLYDIYFYLSCNPQIDEILKKQFQPLLCLLCLHLRLGGMF